MAPALLARAFVGCNYHDCGLGAGCACYHVLEEFFVAWRVDHHILARPGSEMDLGCVDRDVLLLFFSECVEDKCVLELPSLRLTTGSEPFDFSFRQRIRPFEDSPDQSRFPVIDMTNEYDLHMNPLARSFCIACGS